MMRRLQSRTFWIGLLLGLAGVLVMMKLPAFLDSYTSQTNKALLAGDPALLARAKPLLAKDFPTAGELGPLHRAPTIAELRAHGATSVIALSQDAHGLHVVVYAEDPSVAEPSQLRRDLLPLNLQMQTHLPESQVHALIQIPVDVRSVSEKFGSVAAANAAKIIAYVLLVLL